MSQPWRHNILVRILLPSVALILLSNIAILLITVSKLDKQLREGSDGLLRNELQKLQGQFERSIEELIDDTRLLRDIPAVEGISRAYFSGGVDPQDGSSIDSWSARLESFFLAMLRASSSSVQLRYIRADGQEMVRADRYGSGETIRLVRQSALQNKFEREYFKETSALANGEVFLSDIDLNYESGQVMEPRHIVMRAATPVYLKDNLVGVVVINESFDKSFEALKPLTLDTRKLLIANGKGDYLYHFDRSKAITSSRTEHGNFFEDFGVSKAQLPADTISIIHRENESVAMNSIAYNPYNLDDQLIITLIEDYSEPSPIRVQMLNQAYLLIGLAVLISVLLVGINAQRIVAPIRKMKTLLEQSDDGRLKEELPLDAPGEVGTLARAFDQVFRELNQRQSQLQREMAITTKTQRELEGSVNRLAQANHELTEFAYIASHDLQEPLRTITSFIDLLNSEHSDDLNEEGKQFLRFITESSTRMHELIKGLLDFSRVGINATPEKVDCNQLLEDITDDLSVNLEEREGIIEHGNLPVLFAYKTELRLLLQNLITNSLKFSRPDVPPKIRIDARQIADIWQFTVVDNGIGIAPEYRQKVFRIFQRLHSKGEFEGTGIGLAHCKKIVGLHGGDIWVEDAAVEGCRIVFTIKDLENEKTR